MERVPRSVGGSRESFGESQDRAGESWGRGRRRKVERSSREFNRAQQSEDSWARHELIFLLFWTPLSDMR